MNEAAKYLNTDLELAAGEDLTPLVAVFRAAGVAPLNFACDDGKWRATLETDTHYPEPEQNIAALLGVIEALDAAHRQLWHNCTRREFDIGYLWGPEPWGFSQSLSGALLHRVSVVGASLRITLYPERERNTNL